MSNLMCNHQYSTFDCLGFHLIQQSFHQLTALQDNYGSLYKPSFRKSTSYPRNSIISKTGIGGLIASISLHIINQL